MKLPGGATRAVGILAGGTFLGQGLLFLLSPVISRLYGPDDFAVLGVFGSMLSILVVVSSLSYERAIAIPESEREAEHVLKLCFVATFLVGLFTLLLVAFGGNWLARAVHAPHAEPYLLLLPFSVLGAGFYQALNYWSVRKQQYGAISKTKINQSVSQAVVQLGLGAAKWGAAGLIWGDVVNRFAGSVTLARSAARSGVDLMTWSPPDVLRVAKRYRNFPLYASGAAVLHTSASVLPVLILGGLFGSGALAQYTFTQRIVTAPLTVIGVAVAQVFLGQLSAKEGRTRNRVSGLMIRTLQKLAIMGLAVVGLASLGGPGFFSWLFGANWAESGRYVQILSLGLFVQFVVGPVLSVLHVLERQRWLLLADVVGFAAIVGGLYGAKQAGWSVEQALLGYSLALALMYGLIGWLSWKSVQALPLEAASAEVLE